jgi:glutaconate CoA-transferase subunit B
VTVEQVQKQTGFELLIDGTPPATSMPSAEELRVLREQVDSTGMLRERRRA